MKVFYAKTAQRENVRKQTSKLSTLKIKNKHKYTIGGITNLTWYFVTKTSVNIEEIFENTNMVCGQRKNAESSRLWT